VRIRLLADIVILATSHLKNPITSLKVLAIISSKEKPYRDIRG